MAMAKINFKTNVKKIRNLNKNQWQFQYFKKNQKFKHNSMAMAKINFNVNIKKSQKFK